MYYNLLGHIWHIYKVCNVPSNLYTYNTLYKSTNSITTCTSGYFISIYAYLHKIGWVNKRIKKWFLTRHGPKYHVRCTIFINENHFLMLVWSTKSLQKLNEICFVWRNVMLYIALFSFTRIIYYKYGSMVYSIKVHTWLLRYLNITAECI